MPTKQGFRRASGRGSWHMRARVLVLSLGVSLLVTGCFQAAEEKVDREVGVDPGTELHVETRNGAISVVVGGGALGKSKMKVHATKKVRAMSGAKEALGDIKVHVNKKQGALKVSAEHPKGSMTKQYSVSFHVEVPRKTPVRLSSRNGSVKVRGTHGRVWVETRNGSVKVLGVSGDVEVNTKNGAVRLAGAFSKMKVSARNGSIKASTTGDLGKVSGENGSQVNLSTNNGSVRLRGLVGSLDVKSHNGSVRVALDPGSRLVANSAVKTHNGSLEITLPQSFSCSLMAKTNQGRIRSDFGVKKHGKKRVSGVLGEGGMKLSLETRNGGIRIKKR